jgi:ribosomal protein S25
VEDIKRAGQVLTNLARGYALRIGRNYITMDDVKIVAKTVLSTAKIERVKAFIALLDAGEGWITREDLADRLNISLSTAYRLMVELRAIGLVDVELTNEIIYTKNSHPANVRIMFLKKDKFEWCLSKEFKQLRDNFNPTDNRKFMKELDPAYDASQKKIRAEAAKVKKGSPKESKGNRDSSNNSKPSH